MSWQSGLRLDAAVERLLAVDERESVDVEIPDYLDPLLAELSSNSKWTEDFAETRESARSLV